MKKLVLITLLSLGGFAQASYFEISCSTASGDTKHVTGHRFETVITTRSYEPIWTEVRENISDKDVVFEETAVRTVLNEYSQSKCGMASWGSTYVVKAKLFIENEAFGDSVGGAQNGVIEDFFICEEFGNSEIMIDPNSKDCN
jgi:hypothetical protein